MPLLVEVCGGSDFELNDYSGIYFPHVPEGSTIYTQSGSEVISTMKPPSATTMGERLMSVKQLIQIPTFSTFEAGIGAVSRYIPPWFANVSYNSVKALLGLPNVVNGPNSFEGANRVGGILSKFYAFARGGSVVHLYSQEGNPISVYQSLNEATSALTQQPFDLRSRCFPASTPFVMQTGGSALHARLPGFSSLARIPTNYYDPVFSGTFPLNGNTFGGPLCHHYKWATRGSQIHRVYLFTSAADDAVLGHYQGPVPVFIPNSTSTNPTSLQDNSLI